MITVYTEAGKVPVKWWTFPAGERSCKIEGELDTEVLVKVDYRSSDDFVDMMLVVNAIRNVESTIVIDALIPYFPAARQDRVMTDGEPFALQVFAQMVKLCNFRHVEVWDPHSDVLAGMFDPGQLLIVPQWELFGFLGDGGDQTNTLLVSPDAGALKKIYKLAQRVNLPVIEAMKVRDVATGAITHTRVDVSTRPDGPVTLYVVDDIIDGGRTFVELAAVLREAYEIEELVLFATHGIFSKGLEVLECYDRIFVANNMSSLDLDKFNNRNAVDLE